MNMKEPRLLIVEDDLNLGFLLMDFLQENAFEVKLCRDGDSGLEHFRKKSYDLCILDVMLPQMDGFELAQKMKEENADVRFLFLTARSMKSDRIKGYEIGAEDYIIKPFDEDELVCKIKAILRRNNHEQETVSKFQLGKITFDSKMQLLCANGSKKRLTEKENEVLYLLCQNKNQILNRQEAVKQIYGKWDYFLGRSFDVFISRLRKHLRPDPNVRIENVYKVGFILSVAE